MADALRSHIAKGTLRIIQVSSLLDRLRPDNPLNDTYYFVFRCTHCDREFQLNMDTYHGSGSWKGIG
jgi:hypothetical protein